jgi:hypothetical protein
VPRWPSGDEGTALALRRQRPLHIADLAHGTASQFWLYRSATLQPSAGSDSRRTCPGVEQCGPRTCVQRLSSAHAERSAIGRSDAFRCSRQDPVQFVGTAPMTWRQTF